MGTATIHYDQYTALPGVPRLPPGPSRCQRCRPVDRVTGTEDAGKAASPLKRRSLSLLAHQFSPLIYGVAGKHLAAFYSIAKI